MNSPGPFIPPTRLHFACAALLCLGSPASAAQPLEIGLERRPDGTGVDVRMRGGGPSAAPLEARLQHSTDLSTWTPLGRKVRLASGAPAADALLAQDSSSLGFYRLSARESSFAATDGAEVLGYLSSFADQIDALGTFQVADFIARFGPQPNYLPGISWDPTNSLYWDAFQLDHVKTSPVDGRQIFLPALKLSDAELARFRANGFVVSERLAKDGFGDIYYDIFTRDLPVFVTTDSILHAWHRSFDAVVQVVEEGHLRGNLRSLLLAMLGQVSAAKAEYGGGPLATSLADSEYFLAVAARLCSLGTESATPVPADASRFNEALDRIAAAKPVPYTFFDGKQRSEIVDFSQFTPRSHYAKYPALQRYFQAMMWLGRVDLRVAGNPEYASARQLGTAIVLNDLLKRSGQRGSWDKIDRFITTFVGPADSLNFAQLDSLLLAAGLADPKSVVSTAQLESLQKQIEGGTLGTQAIQSHGFVGSAGDDQVKLPRSFTFLGQRFTVDSWTFNQVVYDRVVQPGSNPAKLVLRRLPYSLDVGFAVFANDQIVPDLTANMTRSDGVPFRDGFPYQRNLAAVRLTLDARPADSWTGTLYDSWLLALRTLSTPTAGADYPEAMRTRAWAMKTVNTQLASWTQLRHDTVLYVKQSETPPILCQYPEGFVEPRPGFFRAMKELSTLAADTLQSLGLPAGFNLQRGPINLPEPAGFFRAFASSCATLEAIAQRELGQEPLLPAQVSFLQNTIERTETYWGQRLYNGWYPNLFYWGQNGNGVPVPPFNEIGKPGPPDHDCIFPGFSVADVHTDGLSEPDQDPGAVLHEGVGRVNLLMVAVDNGPDRMVFAGPVYSHYEFTKPYGVRLTDEQWKESVNAGTTPAPPPWTQSYLVRKP